jgi:hypothetical protein
VIDLSVKECPECHGSLERYPKQDIPGAVERYRCVNSHLIGFNIKSQKVTSIILPFKHLEKCPKEGCGLPIGPAEVISDQTTPTRTNGVEDGKGLVRLVYYQCSRGHQSSKRQFIQKKFPEAFA